MDALKQNISIIKNLFAGFFLLSCSSCIKDNFNPLPQFSKTNLENTVPFSDSLKPYFEGIYELKTGNTPLGGKFVAKWKHGTLCLFSEKEGQYVNMETGFNPADSSFRMAGMWRSPINNEQGQIEFTITKEKGAATIFNHNSQGIIMDGIIDGIPISLGFTRPFSDAVLSRNFALLAHRAGGRNSDNLPYAENSLNLVKFAEKLGATGVEIDIRLTKDHIPVIYHDADINTRLTQKSPIVGNIDQYSYGFLKSYIKLVDGQSIPSMEEMLTTIIDSTELSYVWIDCKDGGKAGFFDLVVPVAQKAIAYALLKDRHIAIFFGLPTDDAYEKFLAYPDHLHLPSLCELSLQKAMDAGSEIFAPRWTLGILDDDTETAHANNIKIFTWTLDDETGIKDVIIKSKYDGILSNYPSVVAYQFYSQE
jgi:glycerophosphoryl diester phosphodiesterase